MPAGNPSFCEVYFDTFHLYLKLSLVIKGSFDKSATIQFRNMRKFYGEHSAAGPNLISSFKVKHFRNPRCGESSFLDQNNGVKHLYSDTRPETLEQEGSQTGVRSMISIAQKVQHPTTVSGVVPVIEDVLPMERSSTPSRTYSRRFLYFSSIWTNINYIKKPTEYTISRAKPFEFQLQANDIVLTADPLYMLPTS